MLNLKRIDFHFDIHRYFLNSNNNFKIRVVRGREGLLSIKKDWLELTELVLNKKYFLYYQWYESYINTIENDYHAVFFFIIYKNKTPIAIFPLKKVERRILGIKFSVLEVPDHDHIDLSDFIWGNCDDAQKSVDLFIDNLRYCRDFHWDFVCLPHLLEDSQTLNYLQSCFYPLIVSEFIGWCDYLPSIPYEKIHNSFSNNFKGNLRKARNKLLRMKNVEFISSRNKIDLQHYYKQFINMEASGWKGKDGTKTAIKLHPELTAFYSSLLEEFSKIDGCEINLLKISGECIAAQFCLFVDSTIYVLKIGHDEKYSKLAPGNMLLENLLQRSAADEDIEYINLISGSKWHADWKPLSHKVFRMYIFNKTVTGFWAYHMIKLRKLAKPIYQKYIKQLICNKNKTR